MKKKRRLKRQAKFMIIALFSLGILTVLVMNVSRGNKLKILGANPMVLNLGEVYIEEGVTYKKEQVTDKAEVKNNIDNEKLGSYTVEYIYKTSKGKKIKATRKVLVKDLTLPEITLTNGNEIIITKGEDYVEPGFRALDNVDGDITNKVKVVNNVDTAKEGVYDVIYEVSDKEGNLAKKTRKVKVVSKSPLTMDIKEFSLEGLFKDTILEEKEASEEYMNKIIYVGDSMVLYYDINKLVPTERLWYRNSIDPKSAQSATVYHKYVDTKKTIVEMYQENTPEISILTLGTNSVAYMDIDVFIDNYRVLLKEIKKVSPKTKLIVQSIPPVDHRKDLENSPINNDKINKFNYRLVELCSELGIKFLNSAVAMKDEAGYAKKNYCIDYDGIHPSKEGHNALYEYTKNHAYE